MSRADLLYALRLVLIGIALALLVRSCDEPPAISPADLLRQLEEPPEPAPEEWSI